MSSASRMRFLRNLPVKQKMALITMLTSSVALLLACIAFVAYEREAFRRGMKDEMRVLSEVYAHNVEAGVAFDDASTVADTLQSLAANRHIVAAAVYDEKGDVISVYQRDKQSLGFVPPPPGAPGVAFGENRLDAYQDVIRAGEKAGTVYITSDLEELSERWRRHVRIVCVLLAGCSLVAGLLTARLQKGVSEPIGELVRVAARVTEQKDYSVRATKHAEDELGRLTETFNGMLAQIQERDSALRWAHNELERRVEERTVQLQRENAERKRAESFLHSVLQSLPISVFIKEPANLRYFMWNKATEELCGYPSAEIVGRSDRDLFPEEQAEGFEARDRATLAGKQLVEAEEELLTRFKGRRLLRTRKIPILDEQGEPIYLVGISEDITDQKEAERELAYERDLLRSLLDHSPDYIYFKDINSRFIRCSKAMSDRLGISRDELVGKSDFDLFAEDHAREAMADEQNIVRTGTPVIGKIEKPVWRTGGSSWVLMTKMPLRSKDGQIIGTFGVSKDITAMKEAEAKLAALHQQLLETSRMAGMAEVATGVLHNVGNVLNSVNVSATVVSDQVRNSKAAQLGRVAAMVRERQADLGVFLTTDPKGSKIPGYLEQLAARLAEEQGTVVQEMTSLRRNIDHIKDIVAMQQSYAKVSGVAEVIKPSDLMEDALHMNASALVRHDVQVIRDYDAGVPEICVEKHKVLQILVNLIRNAKYACDEAERPDKQLTVRVEQGEDCVRLSVIDNGAGIAPENLVRIFNHGFTTRKQGHGFGLHSGALAAREMGGTLAVHSAGRGQGASFTLELPLAPASEKKSGRPATALRETAAVD